MYHRFFFQAMVYLFILLTVSCKGQKFLILMKSKLLIFLFWIMILLEYLRNFFLNQSHNDFLPLFIWKFQSFKFYIQFNEFILSQFLYTYDALTKIHIFWYMNIQWFQQHLLSFLHRIALYLCQNQLLIYVGVYFHTLYSVPLIQFSVSIQMPHCLNCSGFIILEIK